ncbi:MAG: DUF3618 domain-containing protein [Sumerlaeia bacterium]
MRNDTKYSTDPGTPPPYPSDASSREIREDVARTRSDMDSTLDEIGRRLHPRHLLDDLLDALSSRTGDGQVKGKAKDAGSTLMHKVKDHPIPAALIGGGLIYMLFESERTPTPHLRRRSHGTRYVPDLSDPYLADSSMLTEERYFARDYPGASRQDPYEDLFDDEFYGRGPGEPFGYEGIAPLSAEEYARRDYSIESGRMSAGPDGGGEGNGPGRAGQAKEKAREGKERATGAAQDAKHRASDAANRAKDKTSHAAGALSDRARYMQERGRIQAAHARRAAAYRAAEARRAAAHGYRAGRDTIAEQVEDNPLVAGFVALAAGALVGLALPKTRREDEWMGDEASRAKARARNLSEEAYHRGRATAASSASAAMDEAERQGIAPGQLAEKGRDVAHRTGDAFSEAAQDRDVDPNSLREKSKAVAQAAKSEAKHEASGGKEQMKAEGQAAKEETKRDVKKEG